MTEPVILALIGLAGTIIGNIFVLIKLKMDGQTTHAAIAQVVDQVAEVHAKVDSQPNKQDLRTLIADIRRNSSSG